MSEELNSDGPLAERIAARGREALVARLRAAYAEAAGAHADIVSIDDERIEAMVQQAADRADGLQWRRALAGVAADELGISLTEALSNPAVAEAQQLVGAPSYEDSLAELIARPVPGHEPAGEDAGATAESASAAEPEAPEPEQEPAAAEPEAPEPEQEPAAAEPEAPEPEQEPAAAEPETPEPEQEPAAAEPETPEPEQEPAAAEPEPEFVRERELAHESTSDDQAIAVQTNPVPADAVPAVEAPQILEEPQPTVEHQLPHEPVHYALEDQADELALMQGDSLSPHEPEEDQLRVSALHLGGVANLPINEEGLDLRLSSDGLDILHSSDEIIGRLRWSEIDELEVPSPRGRLRRSRARARLTVRTQHGDASFEIPAFSTDELRDRIEPMIDRYGSF